MTRAALSALVSHWRRHPGQCLTLILGLALATALWSGVQAINAEARASYDRAAAVLGQDQLARLSRADGQPIPIADYVELRRAGYLVSPVIETELRGPGARLRLLGIDPLTAPPQAQAPDFTDDDIAFDSFLAAPGRLIVSAETASQSLPPDLPPLIISADLAPNTALTDIGTAARLSGQSDPSYLLVAPAQPQGLASLAEAAPNLILTAPRSGDDLGRLTDSFHLNLTAFGLLAFAVGLFIVHAAIGLAFEQRRASFRTLRALGLPLRRLISLLALELTGFAVVSGLIGITLGYAIAAALLPGVSGTLRGLYGADISGQLSFQPLWAVAGMGIALLGTAIASIQALSRVARLPLLAPAQPRAWALASNRTTRRQLATACLLFLVAASLALFGQSLIAGFACLAALLIGAALALPALLAGLLRLTNGLATTPFREWLLADTRQQLPGLSLALMALLLALAANIGVSTMVGSFRGTFTGWLDQRLASELYITARSPSEAQDITTWVTPQVDAVLPIISAPVSLYQRPGELYGIADHATYRDHWPLLAAAPDVWDQIATGQAVLINEQLARREGLTPGDVVALTPGWSLPIAGVYSDYGNPEGQAIIGLDLFNARFPDLAHRRLALRLAPEDVPALAEALRAAFNLPGANVVNQDQIKRFSLRVFEQTFLITGALNILTLGVASFALLTSLLTLAGLRLPQLAPIWALGQTRRTLAQAELIRTALLTCLTFILAIPVGLALAWVLLAVVNVEAFGWRLPMQVFPADWARLGLYALLAALLAAAWPAWRLARIAPATLLKVFAHER
ncbi:FtsX-like permease family protein [Roseobacter sp. HKCCD9010]|uniref:ABC transporter permease n=1 Tax=unclassified Roseobacter TaxID=196798 RepID=UPI001490AA50|nr:MULTISPECIES: ABC transporter permease [unclassified Roseobacter]MBF9048398.1 FtsX-like permease family protein [Rhodobacterales bacterium HKCCD4356]NNV10397.1 FtsX-like permease family protein [Roseobacter sp. HKCCD7357]NNV14582.1 FtsX-like permease family protein [Roseobacter sp. HKCCD8768]NNV24041.1 FtsX-like permease family protein [Roseobacter sp. HKCCD8192]NNV28298.1 FtsX-like permease family protein [Roseobacter sp. HKCCD9061]